MSTKAQTSQIPASKPTSSKSSSTMEIASKASKTKAISSSGAASHLPPTRSSTSIRMVVEIASRATSSEAKAIPSKSREEKKKKARPDWLFKDADDFRDVWDFDENYRADFIPESIRLKRMTAKQDRRFRDWENLQKKQRAWLLEHEGPEAARKFRTWYF